MLYKDFDIEVIEDEPGKFKAVIRRPDGRLVRTALPLGPEVLVITTLLQPRRCDSSVWSKPAYFFDITIPPQRLDRAGNVTAGNRDRDTLPVLVGLAIPDRHSQTALGFLDIVHVKRSLGFAAKYPSASMEWVLPPPIACLSSKTAWPLPIPEIFV